MELKRLWVALAVALTTMASPLAAQQAGDTVTVTITGVLTTATITSELLQAYRPGATIQFEAVALDEDGDTLTNVIYTWSSSDTSIVQIDPETGFALAVGKGVVRISVMAEQVDELVVGWYTVRDGPEWFRLVRDSAPNITVPDPLPVLADERAIQLCAYLVDRNDRLVVQSEGSPGSPCPVAFPPPPLNDEFATMWLLRERLLPFATVEAFASDLRLADPQGA